MSNEPDFEFMLHKVIETAYDTGYYAKWQGRNTPEHAARLEAGKDYTNQVKAMWRQTQEELAELRSQQVQRACDYYSRMVQRTWPEDIYLTPQQVVDVILRNPDWRTEDG